MLLSLDFSFFVTLLPQLGTLRSIFDDLWLVFFLSASRTCLEPPVTPETSGNPNLETNMLVLAFLRFNTPREEKILTLQRETLATLGDLLVPFKAKSSNLTSLHICCCSCFAEIRGETLHSIEEAWPNKSGAWPNKSCESMSIFSLGCVVVRLL